MNGISALIRVLKEGETERQRERELASFLCSPNHVRTQGEAGSLHLGEGTHQR